MNQSLIWIGEQSASPNDWSVKGNEGWLIQDVVLLKHTARSSIQDSPNFHRTVRSSSEVQNAGKSVALKNEKVLDASSDLDTNASQLDLWVSLQLKSFLKKRIPKPFLKSQISPRTKEASEVSSSNWSIFFDPKSALFFVLFFHF